MLRQLLLTILDWVLGFLAFLLLARFVMQWARAPFRNSIGEFVIALTDWAVKPARRVIPSLLGFDLASLILAWLAQALYVLATLAIGATHLDPGAALLLSLALGAFELLRVAIYLVIGVVLISAILSWVNPYAPVAPVFNAVSRPFLRPFQRVVPLIANIDLSPLVLLLVLQLALAMIDWARMAVLSTGG